MDSSAEVGPTLSSSGVPEFDLFVSYSARDVSLVKQLKQGLERLGLRIWFDDEQIKGGDSFQTRLDEGLRASHTACVFIGGPIEGWQKLEIEAALILGRNRNMRVIPVLLPGAPSDIATSIFLERNSMVVFRSIEDQDALDRIAWAVTGKKPSQAPPIQQDPTGGSSSDDPVAEAVSSLMNWVPQGNITFFLGPAASSVRDQAPRGSYEIARRLLDDLKLIKSTESMLLPPVDIAAVYYAVRNNDPGLEIRVVKLIESDYIPPTHLKLAAIVKKLQTFSRARGRRALKQLIVTTQFDLMMERALLQAQINFTRVVQHRPDHRNQTRIYVDDFSDVQFIRANQAVVGGDSKRVFNLNTFGELDDLISSHVRTKHDPESLKGVDLKEPILYKFCGSQDIPDSCSISSSHYFELMRTVLELKAVPGEVMSILENTPLLFLGLGLLSPEFRLSYHTLLRDALKSDYDKFLLQLPPESEAEDGYRQMERGLWKYIKTIGLQRKITTVEQRSDVFLDALLARL